ncbi:beta-lactamase domain-containing protein [Alicyclobacillus hesperidum URH17-3-68]|uniref:MBL fold metallo-hydrolase n=1 Tax=Alicyclobacillus hesperidum TaxID=89784 RepID=UPI000281B334|nr:MBL fold metallo-hydrolase [Alicyclobacillus hesperidum]EJY55721.1 beta-lactamase domain-containing protein [Alicyclobacillus hesperidum URH17-3-68]
MTQQLRAASAAEVYERILRKEPLFILDVRNEDAYADWRIEGESVRSFNVPYFDLLDGVDSVLGKLPQDVPVLVVCAKEGSSKFVAEQLVEAGLHDIAYLAGGMQAWSEYLHPVKIGDLASGGAIYQFVRVGKGCLSYAIVSDGEAAIVDPARMTDVYVQFAKEQGVSIRYAIDTHLHADHISGGRRLAEAVGATYFLPPKDAPEATFVFTPLEEGNTIAVGRSVIEIKPVYSPGHTIGSTSLIVDQQYLLTGDILFVASIGRPDLAGKAGDWAPDLRKTLYQTYRQLSPELRVLPAHYATEAELDSDGRVSARLGDLYQVNPGLRLEDDAEFRKAVTENLPPQPNAYQEIRLTNMGKLKPSDAEASEMEIGPNRCAIHG